MHRIINIFKDALLYFLQISIYSWPSLLAGNLLFGPIVYFIVNGFWGRIVEIVSSIMILCVLLFVFAYKRGYKKVEFYGVSLAVSLILAAGLQLLYAWLFRYTVYTGAGAHYLALYLYNSERSADYY